MKSNIFPDYFVNICKDIVNEANNIALEVKNNIKRIAMEQGIYAKVVKVVWKDLKFIAENKNKNEAKYNFRGQSAWSQRWFDVDFDWTKVNLAHVNLISIIWNICSSNSEFKVCGKF